MSNSSYRQARLKRADGPYPAGCLVTTDPSAAFSPESRADKKAPVFVDAARFAQWLEDGFLTKPNGGGEDASGGEDSSGAGEESEGSHG